MYTKYYFGYICNNGNVFSVKWEEVNGIAVGGKIPTVGTRFEITKLDFLNLTLRDLMIKHPCKDLPDLT